MVKNNSSNTDLKLGLYRHYKGGEYQILYLATDKIKNKLQVVYKDRDSEDYYLRSLKNFQGKVKVGKVLKPRFEFISDIPFDSWEARYRRALADYQNLIRETAKEKEKYYSYALQGFIEEILPVYDNLKISIHSLTEKEATNPWVEGIKYVIKQFFQVLISQGISEINTLGEVFNPETMEAVKDLEVVKTKSTKLGNDNLVKKQIVPGYKLKDKVIRPARVVVSD